MPKGLVDSFVGGDRCWCGFEVCSPALWATDEGIATGLSAETAEERLNTALDAPLPFVEQEDVPWWWFVTSLFRKFFDRWVAGVGDRDKVDPDTRGLGRRGALGTYADNGTKFVPSDPELGAPSSPLAIPEAVRELLKCRHPQVVAEFMSTGNRRPAYSFSAYRDGRYGIVDNKRTVEFRQATGTFDADEVCAWARVCFRQCEWAVAAELPEYWKIVLDCASADADGAWYDVFHLILADLGLLAEASALKRIAYKRQGLEPKGGLIS
ncbi:hypothetical protein DL764_009347 [Monosporascus ibericus]|uniref:Uncharacterized protein n=1 Tax=Monosporascus ibericus TaxID=155417 RepID=A0A4Q4SY36_9PEZI|nr:hypothetical protein DL764_009347 [Monosporascus ibericus]